MAVAVALVRGFARSRTNRVGNFWVDLVRGCVRILLPLSIVATVLLIAAGVVQNLADRTRSPPSPGRRSTCPAVRSPARRRSRSSGTNGGGFYNANSAHPFENPNAFTNLLEIVLLLLIPFALPRTFGKLLGDKRQGWAILSVMAVIFAASLTLVTTLRGAAPRGRRCRRRVRRWRARRCASACRPRRCSRTRPR